MSDHIAPDEVDQSVPRAPVSDEVRAVISERRMRIWSAASEAFDGPDFTLYENTTHYVGFEGFTDMLAVGMTENSIVRYTIGPDDILQVVKLK